MLALTKYTPLDFLKPRLTVDPPLRPVSEQNELHEWISQTLSISGGHPIDRRTAESERLIPRLGQSRSGINKEGSHLMAGVGPWELPCPVCRQGSDRP